MGENIFTGDLEHETESDNYRVGRGAVLRGGPWTGHGAAAAGEDD